MVIIFFFFICIFDFMQYTNGEVSGNSQKLLKKHPRFPLLSTYNKINLYSDPKNPPKNSCLSLKKHKRNKKKQGKMREIEKAISKLQFSLGFSCFPQPQEVPLAACYHSKVFQ